MLIRHMGGLDVFKEYVLEKILNETLPAVRTSSFSQIYDSESKAPHSTLAPDGKA